MILTVERLGHLGDAVLRGPDGPIFAARLLPGEVVEGAVEGDRLTAPKIVTPSADRVRPPCPHARTCGGCLLQHASDGFVSDWKTGVIVSALAGQGLSAPMLPIHTSPTRTRRRATLAGRRTKTGAIVGFHARASGTLVAIPECHLLHPDLMASLPALEALTVTGGSRSLELALTVTQTRGGVDVAVTGGKPLDGPLRLALARITEEAGLARLTWAGETVALRTSPMLALGRARVVPPPGAFLQATEDGAQALLGAVRDAVGDASRIVDLFAGIGTFSLPLAERADVLAVEGDVAMTAALDRGWRQAEGLHRVDAQTRDLFRRPLEPGEFRGVDAVVIDPPRAGAEAQTRTLAAARVPVIAALSCNPVTFARDARILCDAGYALERVLPVDQFRWSAHVELGATFRL